MTKCSDCKYYDGDCNHMLFDPFRGYFDGKKAKGGSQCMFHEWRGGEFQVVEKEVKGTGDNTDGIPVKGQKKHKDGK